MLKNSELSKNKSVNNPEKADSGSHGIDIDLYQYGEYELVGYDIIKRILDLSLVFILLPCFTLAMAIIAIAIKLDSPGPIIYKHPRIGKHGKTIGLYRFRTTHLSVANDIIDEYFSKLVSDPIIPDELKKNIDPRVSFIGRFLRRTSFDELPQVFNIFSGDMSLVGPRALLPFEVEYLSEEMKKRFSVPPGLIGLGQIEALNGSSFTRIREKDVEYVNRRSFILDLEIILRTVIKIIHGIFLGEPRN